jgi:nucleoside-diphosphate-sugar epimerase
MMNLVYDNLIKGKPAQWFSNADVIHSTGFVPDLARGTAMLGNSQNTFNQIWNLPVDKEALTGRQWVNLFAAELKASDKVQVIPGWGLRLLGVFVPILREMPEMLYQSDRDYYFDSGKFRARFNYTPTANKDAVSQTVQLLRKNADL